MDAVFFEIHSGLAHEAPGSRADTSAALALIGRGGALDILDAGCGPGLASLALLEALPEARVLAVDLHAPFVEDAKSRIAAAGFGDRFEARLADMAAPCGDRQFDLVWCEGAAYALGVTTALTAWRPLLAPGGAVVFSELIWTTGTRPAPAEAFFAQEYFGMTDQAGVMARIAAAGYRVKATHTVSEAGWQAYYGPLETRARTVARRHGFDAASVRDTLEEIAIWRAHGSAYGYVFFVAEP